MERKVSIDGERGGRIDEKVFVGGEVGLSSVLMFDAVLLDLFRLLRLLFFFDVVLCVVIGDCSLIALLISCVIGGAETMPLPPPPLDIFSSSTTDKDLLLFLLFFICLVVGNEPNTAKQICGVRSNHAS